MNSEFVFFLIFGAGSFAGAAVGSLIGIGITVKVIEALVKEKS